MLHIDYIATVREIDGQKVVVRAVPLPSNVQGGHDATTADRRQAWADAFDSLRHVTTEWKRKGPYGH